MSEQDETDRNGSAGPDGEDAFEDALRRALKSEPAAVPDPRFGWARLSRALPERAASRVGTVRAWQAAAAALLVVALAQGTWIATQGDGSLRLAGTETSLLVGFRPGTGEAEMRALLREAGMQVVGGPSALGLWKVAAREPVAARAALEGAEIVETVSGP